MSRKIVVIISVILLSIGNSNAADTAYYSKLIKDPLTIPVFYNSSVKNKIKSLLADKYNTTAILNRAAGSMSEIEATFLEKNIPKELAVISISNSEFKPSYISEEDGAVGVYPLSYTMAKRYGLSINSYIDERRSIGSSTPAAASFILELQNIYKDWHKTIVAFKSGAIKVNMAIHKANGNLEFKSVYEKMAAKERAVLENYYAWLYIYNHHKDHKIKLEPVKLMPVDTVLIVRDIHQPILAKVLEIDEKVLKSYNPILKTSFLPGSLESFNYYLPKGKKELYEQHKNAIADSSEKLLNPVVVIQKPVTTTNTTNTSSGKKLIRYKIKSGDNLGLIADVFDVYISQIKKWNNIRGTRIIAGKYLKIYVKSSKYSKYKAVNGMSMSRKRALARRD
jgi:membrane-bound lytic murein transglycosylase D